MSNATNAVVYETAANLQTNNVPNVVKYSFDLKKKSLSPDNQDIYTFVITTNQIDRDNDKLQTRGILTEGFIANPVLLYMHNGLLLPVGTVQKIWIVTENGTDIMYGDIVFHLLDEASIEAKKYVDANVLRAVSIAFRTIKSHKEPAPPEYVRTFDGYTIDTINVIDQSEMIEVSIVTVPANASAVRVKALQAYKDHKLTDKQLHQLLEHCDMADTIEKSGARLSGSSQELVTKALSCIDEHEKSLSDHVKSAKKAFGDARAHLNALIDGPPPKEKPSNDKTEPDSDDEEKTLTLTESELVGVVNKCVNGVRKDFDREFKLLHETIEKSQNKGGCSCNHDKASNNETNQDKTFTIDDLKKHFKKDN